MGFSNVATRSKTSSGKCPVPTTLGGDGAKACKGNWRRLRWKNGNEESLVSEVALKHLSACGLGVKYGRKSDIKNTYKH